jgi:hypothetical protein
MINIENAFLYRNIRDVNVQTARGYNNADSRGQKKCKKGTTTKKDQVGFSYHSQLDFSDFLGSDAFIIASVMNQRYLTAEYHTIALLLRSIHPYMSPLVDEITSLYKHVILVYYSIFWRLPNQVSKKDL